MLSLALSLTRWGEPGSQNMGVCTVVLSWTRLDIGGLQIASESASEVGGQGGKLEDLVPKSQAFKPRPMSLQAITAAVRLLECWRAAIGSVWRPPLLSFVRLPLEPRARG